MGCVITPGVPGTLPPGVAAELGAAISRTGLTEALRIAAERLQMLYSMTPAELEEYAGKLYLETV